MMLTNFYIGRELLFFLIREYKLAVEINGSSPSKIKSKNYLNNSFKNYSSINITKLNYNNNNNNNNLFVLIYKI